MREDVRRAMSETSEARLVGVLKALGIAASSWYRKPASEPRRPGPRPGTASPETILWVSSMARANPWYGYKRIAVMCRKAGQPVTNRDAYRVMRDAGLLHKRVRRVAEFYQAAKLFELLPQGANELWQMDVTYLHIPGWGWWYGVTVIDYYSRYLLAAHLTDSYSAGATIYALQLAREEAERIGGPLKNVPFLVTDNGPSFIARRFEEFARGLFSHVRIAYRTPTQLGLLERFHRTLKDEEIYWRMYDSPAHGRRCLAEFRERYNTRRPHWALVPEEGGDPLTPHEVYAEGRQVGIPKWQGWAVAAKAKLEEMMEAVA